MQVDSKNEILLVGSFHFEQEGEIIKTKESEVEELVEHLSTFAPNKIALEWDRKDHVQLNKQYHQHHQQNHLRHHEIEQIGFRLGNRLGHKEVFAVDWEGRISRQDADSLQQTIQRDYPDIVHKMNAYINEAGELTKETHLINSYAALNRIKMVEKLEEMYLSFVRVANKTEDIGMDFLNKWIERELKIFHHILEISEDTNERVLLLIGNDHVWMLKNLFEGFGWRVIIPFE
jgi:hypothetical protein